MTPSLGYSCSGTNCSSTMKFIFSVKTLDVWNMMQSPFTMYKIDQVFLYFTLMQGIFFPRGHPVRVHIFEERGLHIQAVTRLQVFKEEVRECREPTQPTPAQLQLLEPMDPQSSLDLKRILMISKVLIMMKTAIITFDRITKKVNKYFDTNS